MKKHDFSVHIKFAGLLLALVFSTSLCVTAAAQSSPDAGTAKTRHVDLAICLDVSGSMEGLINSAKQKLWDVVNELATAKPAPELRVAILTYGNPSYGEGTGWVRTDLELTGDLDAVNQKLFSFTTNGGTEYVGRVVSRAGSSLKWSEDKDALKLLFVAGNEGADQDQEVNFRNAVKEAIGKGIQVNSIYCGRNTDADAPGWQEVAKLGDGKYTNIDQNVAAVAAVATPMDGELVRLNDELNKTYVAYGTKGKESQANQIVQDKNAAGMSEQAAASRAVTKGSTLYKTSSWDLVGAVNDGLKLEEVPEAELPEEMKKMKDKEREHYVAQMQQKRSELQQKIAQTEQQRRAYIDEQTKKNPSPAGQGLDAALKSMIREQAQQKGFSFN
jgi:hypothetical protein